tara:strand:+ start:267 stop:488 length:222 start_codon:yes stop_codon:yes gene_type:complete
MGYASKFDLEQREMFEQDADELNEEDFVAKHGEVVRFHSDVFKREVTVNAREWYKGYEYEKHAPDEPFEAPLD